MNYLTELEEWYLAQCDEDWEHTYGISIGTLDDPGWSLTVDLAGTELRGRTYPGLRYGVGEAAESSGNDWVYCKVEGDRFIARGGPQKLEEMISAFLRWANSAA